MDEAGITIIGAGVVGLSVASALSAKYDNVVVIEKHGGFGRETSSRNSEVIHSGIYYPQGSLKARLCVEGAALLYEICRRFSIPCRKPGKIIVATEQSELRALESIFENGRKNDVRDLSILGKSEIAKLEPHTTATAAIYSPHTGIVDSHALMKYFFNSAQEKGVLFAFRSEVEFISKEKEGFVIGVREDDYRFTSQIVINCAGLRADSIAVLAGIDIEKNGYRLKFCKGSYFSYERPSPVGMLIYPVPHAGSAGLGIHATLNLGDRLRFGPDAEYVESIDYRVDVNKREAFYERASRIIPGLAKDAFAPDIAGIRPKLSGPGEKVRDFIIRDETEKGLPGLINLIGIESPGLTASPAIAAMVCSIVDNLT